MEYQGDLRKCPLDDSEISEQFPPRKLICVGGIGYIDKFTDREINLRLATYNIPLSELPAISLALYPPQQHLSTEYVLDKYKVPTPNFTLRTDLISPSVLPMFNIRFHGFIFHAACPGICSKAELMNYEIRMFKPDHTFALVRYIYTHKVSLIVGSLLRVTRFIEEEDLKQPKIASVNWNPIILLMMQTKTVRELDDLGVGIIAF
ncbi:hypothetical protein ARMSODRAFT_1025919 [Armillaria solidipes]|uniref:Uncharacterized protein n=1 Tax=Armillaria solidipes TaxID=1076256 RepID=A0A2H3AQY3_9AGAR|nr:hypothetical protein ARMSODRAFT_1025919 [Armillaria solidipes]